MRRTAVLLSAMLVALLVEACAHSPFDGEPDVGPLFQAGTVLEDLQKNEIRFVYQYLNSNVWVQGYLDLQGFYSDASNQPVPPRLAPLLALESVSREISRSESYPYYVVTAVDGPGAIVCFFSPLEANRMVSEKNRDWVGVVGRVAGATTDAEGTPLVFMNGCRQRAPGIEPAVEPVITPNAAVAAEKPARALPEAKVDSGATPPPSGSELAPTVGAKPAVATPPTPPAADASEDDLEDLGPPLEELPALTSPGCKKNRDCKRPRKCVEGVCVDPSRKTKQR